MLAALVLLGFLLFVYMLVPLCCRASSRPSSESATPSCLWSAGCCPTKRTAWFAVWTIWTLGLAIGLPFAIHDWRQSSNVPIQQQGP